ncbi:MAG TPA: DUF992 domain-containing protein [Xanthobacteraceae bacterium]|jgi:hypothetical protein|nr:DUF992 domain-containing protein [Xanthobacteraceae bacterium]
MTRSSTIGFALAAALALFSTGASAQGVNAGLLECRGIGATGFIIGSVHELECVFKTEYMPPVRYHGIVRKFGLDVGITERSVLAWGVIAPTARIGPGDLAGLYGGVTAGAAVIVGAGANALVGGSGNTIALQPVSVEGQTGINVTLGVASLELRYGP